MRRTMITDQQYNALVASRSGGSSQLLHPSQGAQYLSLKRYAERVEPYHPAAVGTGVAGSAVPYPASARAAADNYPDPQDLRAQLVAERRGAGLLPSPALVDYSPSTYVDHVGPRGVLAAAPISPEVVGAYPSHYTSPQRGAPPLSNAELLAARARRSDLTAPYPSGYGNEVPVRRIPAATSYDDPGLVPGSAAGILGSGAVRRGRELDRYLLSVQPEKLVRYAASVLAPDPDLRRNGYSVVGNNLTSKEDMYSNYRRAKARRTGSHEFGGSGEPGSQRDRERDVYRDREQDFRERRGGESGRERGKRSPDRRQSNGSLSKSNDANRVDRHNASQSSGGRRDQQNGGQNKRGRESEKLEKAAVPKGKVENSNSDKDSELGSLCADITDSDEDKVEKKSEEAATVIDCPLAGMVFGCSTATFHECMRLQLFGLPAKNKEDVLRVTPGTKVFLFNFDTKELSGIFEAVSHGGWQLQPDAFRDFGGFPAQVQVCCSEQCPNIPQSLFKPAIRENYVNSTRFKFDLNTKQVKELVRMFRQAAKNRLRQQQDPLADRYLSARLPPDDYLARGDPQQQRPYSRHPQARFGTSRVVPYDDARVMMISMSANKTTANFRKKSKRRGSKRAQLKKGRKKRKVSTTNKPESPPPPILVDNCSLYSISGEMIPEADDDDDDDTSNPNNAVIVFREGIEAGSSRNVDHQPKEIVETPPAAKGLIVPPSGPDHGLSPSKRPEEIPQPQSDLGKQEVSFVEDDSYNAGNFRLAGSRADEQGQGLGLDVPLQGALSTGNVIKSSDCTLSSVVEGLCSDAQGDFSTMMDSPETLMNLGGNNAPSSINGDGQLSELDDEKRSRKGLGHIAVPPHDNSHTYESISSEFGSGGKLPVKMDELFRETVEDETDCTLCSVGNDEELEAIAAEVAVGPEAPCVREEVMVAAEVAICPEARGREEMMVATVVVTEVATNSEAPSVIGEEMVASVVVGKVEELGVIVAEVTRNSEALSVREEMMVVAGVAGKDGELEVTAIDSETPIVIEKVTITSAVVGKDGEFGVTAAHSEAPCVREEVMVVNEVPSKDKELEVTAIESEALIFTEEVTNAPAVVAKDGVGVIVAEVAIDAELPIVIEEVITASAVTGKDEKSGVIATEVAVDSEAPCVREEDMIAAEAVGNGEGLEVIAAEVTTDSEGPCVRDEVMIVAETDNVEVIAAEVTLGSQAPCMRQEVIIAAGADGKDEKLEVIATEVAIDSEAGVDPGAPSVREEVMVAEKVVHEDEEVEMIADEFAVDCEAPVDREEVMTIAEAVGQDEEIEVIAVEDSEAPCFREEEMIAAQALSSHLLASADMVTTDHDDGNHREEVILAADAVDSDQPPSPDLNVIHGDDADEEDVLPADNAEDCEIATSPDEDEDEEGKDQQDYDYEYYYDDDGDADVDNDGEEEETVDVSVDGDLSNGGEDGDEDEDIGEAVDDDGSFDMD